jgi:hypothetical protein
VRRLALLLTLVLLLAGCGGAEKGAQHATPRTAAVKTARRDGVPRLRHVFLIVGENTSAKEITAAHAPYMVGRLKPRAAWLPGYRSFKRSSSLGQYIAMVSGQYTKCEANNDLPATCHQKVANLFSQLDAAGSSWTDWEQSMTNACDIFDHGMAWAKNIYSAHHNPAIYFTQIYGAKYDEAVAASPKCRAGDVSTGTTAPNDTTALDAALRAGRVSDFNLIVPDDCANGHDPCGTTDHVRQFDDFLAKEIPRIESSPGYGASDAIIVAWDEGNDPPFDVTNPLLAVTGAAVKPGVYEGRYDHFGLERTLADALGVAPLAHARSARPLAAIWR